MHGAKLWWELIPRGGQITGSNVIQLQMTNY